MSAPGKCCSLKVLLVVLLGSVKEYFVGTILSFHKPPENDAITTSSAQARKLPADSSNHIQETNFYQCYSIRRLTRLHASHGVVITSQSIAEFSNGRETPWEERDPHSKLPHCSHHLSSGRWVLDRCDPRPSLTNRPSSRFTFPGKQLSWVFYPVIHL